MKKVAWLGLRFCI